MTRRSCRAASAAVAVVLVVALGACGGGRGAGRLVIPTAVNPDLAPAVLPVTDLTLTEYTAAKKSFAQVGATSLVADGRLWQIRRGASLVGTLQISTVKPDVSIAKPKDRKAIINGVMTGASYETITIDDVPVAVSTSKDKSLYLWFGPGMFEVMLLKGSQLTPEDVVTEVLKYQETFAHLTPVGAGDPSVDGP